MSAKLFNHPTVEELGVDEDAGVFFIRIEAKQDHGGALHVIGTTFKFSIEEMSKGQSLAAEMNVRMRKFLGSSKCETLTEADKKLFRQAGTDGVRVLRKVIEPYFALQALRDGGKFQQPTS